DADAKPNPHVFRYLELAVGHPALDVDSAPHGIQNTRKFRQEAVAGIFYDAAPMLRDLRIDQLPEMRFEPLVRSFFVSSHQKGVAGHIGGEVRHPMRPEGPSCGRCSKSDLRR